MPHRGRLNVLANVMDKPYTAIFSEFQGRSAQPEEVRGSGDVKYHLGTSADREFDGTHDPSLADAQPLASRGGQSRWCWARCAPSRTSSGDTERSQVMAILMHGDAAFAGQGLVAESLDLSELERLPHRRHHPFHRQQPDRLHHHCRPTRARARTARTSPRSCRRRSSTSTATIPEAVVHVARIATEFRQQFKSDVVIDMFCYRRHGHNEWRRAGVHPAADVQGDRAAITTVQRGLCRSGSRPKASIDAGRGRRRSTPTLRREARQGARGGEPATSPTRPTGWRARWAGLHGRAGRGGPQGRHRRRASSSCCAVGRAISEPPKNFDLNRKIARLLAGEAQGDRDRQGHRLGDRRGAGLRHAAAPRARRCGCRGQDVGRGTFTQRHAVLIDQATEEQVHPAQHIAAEGQAQLRGASTARCPRRACWASSTATRSADPNALVMWEAQFGDFANGAQVIIDQFICSGESKWLRMYGLVMLLPHGYEGQGPEHSSARLERYLQLSPRTTCRSSMPTHAGQLLPCAAPPAAPHLPQAADRDDAEVAAAPQGLRLDAGRLRAGHLVPPHPAGDRPARRRRPRSRRVVLCSRQGLLTTCVAERAQAQDRRHRHRCASSSSIPSRAAGSACELARYPNAEVVWCQEEPREHGRLVLRRPPHRARRCRASRQRAADLYRPAGSGVAGHRLGAHARKEQADLVDRALTIG